MPTIHWNSSYATGIEAIDAQHKNMIEHIQKLQESLHEGRVHEETTELMGFLLHYVDEHFTMEEAYMEHIGYPQLGQHQELHRQLRFRVQGIADRLARADSSANIDLSLLLFEWLRDHILRDDSAYVEHARSRPKRTTELH